MDKIKKSIIGVITDPGVGFCVIDILLFWQTGGVGLASMIIATTVASSFKALSIINPKFIQKNNKFSRIAKDSRTPLRVCGLALIAVTGTAMGGALIGPIPALPILWQAAILPAITSTSFSIANFCLANSLSTDKKAIFNKKTKLTKRIIKSPDTYITLGLIGAGLMSGGASLIALPVILTGYGVTIHNSIHKKEEFKRHPKLFSAVSCAVYSVVGFATGNIYPAIANLLNVGILTKIESELTPDGFKQIVKDIKRDTVSIKKTLPVLTKRHVKIKLQQSNKLTSDMNKKAKKPANSNKVSVPTPASKSIKKRKL